MQPGRFGAADITMVDQNLFHTQFLGNLLQQSKISARVMQLHFGNINAFLLRQLLQRPQQRGEIAELAIENSGVAQRENIRLTGFFFCFLSGRFIAVVESNVRHIRIQSREQFPPQAFRYCRNAICVADRIILNPLQIPVIRAAIECAGSQRIPEILDQIPPEAIMYLVNALAFEAEWSEIYEKHQVKDGEFTKEDGTKQDVKFMYGSEGTYFEDEKATGFMKRYKGGKYAFVAMLPNEGVSVSEYIASLTGESLNALLSNPQYGTVHTSMPKFETEHTVEMAEILKGMGMTEAFDMYNADFEGLGTSTAGNIYISRVLHKTFISVGEKGTKAGAATVVEMADDAAAEPQEPKEVYLDRPFVYMLIDCENNIPFFIGTMMDVN